MLLKEGEAVNHRSIPPRLGSQPALSVLCVRRRSRRVVALPRFRFALMPSAFVLFRRPAPLGATPGGYRSHASGCSLSLHRYALLWLRSEGVHASGTRRPHQPLWGSLYGSAISFTGDTPTCPNTKKGDGCPSPSWVQIPTFPSRARRFRACWNPTLSRPPSPGDRRSERSGCVRPRPVPQHLRVAWRGFR